MKSSGCELRMFRKYTALGFQKHTSSRVDSRVEGSCTGAVGESRDGRGWHVFCPNTLYHRGSFLQGRRDQSVGEPDRRRSEVRKSRYDDGRLSSGSIGFHIGTSEGGRRAYPIRRVRQYYPEPPNDGSDFKYNTVTSRPSFSSQKWFEVALAPSRFQIWEAPKIISHDSI